MESFFTNFDQTQIDDSTTLGDIVQPSLDSLLANIDIEDSNPSVNYENESVEKDENATNDNNNNNNNNNNSNNNNNNNNNNDNNLQKNTKKKKPKEQYIERPKKYPVIVNCCASIHLGCKDLDLMKISHQARNASYNPKRFKAVSIRLRDPATTCHVFGNGRVVTVGGKSVREAKVSTRKVASMVKKIGPYPCKWKDFKVLSMMTSADCGFRVDLFSLSMEHGDFATYEPEIFSGCVYRMVEPKATLMIFHSGKFLVIAKDEKKLREIFDSIYPVLLQYKSK